MNDIIDFMKAQDGASLRLNNSWLFWDGSEWVVCTHTRYAKTVKIIERTDSLSVALRALARDED
jgi:hypothetical protein